MSKEVLVQFMGFESKDSVREYVFQVREASTDPVGPRMFTISIDQDAFNSHLVRFQDAPDICSARLRRELIAFGNQPAESHFHITRAELDEYRSRHTPAKRSMFHRVPTEEY
jgi:hypothetical protein